MQLLESEFKVARLSVPVLENIFKTGFLQITKYSTDTTTDL